ncbi:glyoxalase [Burkholderia sp. WAC0059]|uniref:VOC family protein n=1 Tax=Burkholderia sp. WAC0059 TaxID=2066022 RepID=UPI000C7F5179|nr:VOC family protein [Burkholderia sp. WAC0059]PLZ00591.1 glyoxalase [Burkholderia sp. WAC0059]
MEKLRHIALSVSDPDQAATFFEQAFGMKRAGRAMRGWYMTDGVMNVALLNFKDESVPGYAGLKDVRGVIHFGMWVDNLEAAEKRVVAAGGTYLTGRKETDPNVYYEVKYRTPDGIVFDITESGWKGAVKEVVPSEIEAGNASEKG